MLYFGDDLEPVFIFVGLAFLVLIGPLLRWYVLGMTRPDFKLPRRYYFLELAPFMILFIASLFVTEEWYKNSKLVIIIFSSGLIFIYLHFAFYIALAWRAYKRTKAKEEQGLRTKSQKAVLQWLYVVLIGFILIWVSYVLNILDEAVPYVIGPIVYSVVVYYLSYRAFVLKVTDLDGSVFKVTGDHSLYDAIVNRIVKEQLYLEPDISLTRLSKMLGKSTQQISTVINQYANRNFNDFINYYRIQDAKALLLDPKSEKYTIRPSLLIWALAACPHLTVPLRNLKARLLRPFGSQVNHNRSVLTGL